ncbi:MAG: LPP20 family lipoprotein [Gammaproteobacteria bacterium]|nr:LPP20 family lipoprotein [Gammaproteobacteria bacterium]
MNSKHIFQFTTYICMSVLSGCQSPGFFNKPQSHEIICLNTPALRHNVFYASGSAATLEQAKLNARQDLVQQISSNVSSTIENTKTDHDGKLSQLSLNRAKSESTAIPVDQHKLVDSCKSASTYYVAISLNHAALVKSTKLRLEKEIRQAKSSLGLVKDASLYQQYIQHQQLSRQHKSINAFKDILLQYDKKPLSREITAFISTLETFLLSSGNLTVSIRTGPHLGALRGTLEQALNSAKLAYKTDSNDTVASISLRAKQNHYFKNNRHFVRLRAVLEVFRNDTQQLLSRHDLKFVVHSSSVSSELALENAQQALSLKLNKLLSSEPEKLRKILGLEKNEE